MKHLDENDLSFLKKWSGIFEEENRPKKENKKEYYTMEPKKAVGEFWVYKNTEVDGKVEKKEHIDSFESEAMARKWYPSLK